MVGEEEKTTNSRKQQHQLTITEFYERVPPEQTDDGQGISCPDLVPETDTFGDNVDNVEIPRDDLLCPGRTPSSSSLQEVPDTSERGENNRDNDHIMMESTAPPVDRACSYKKGICSIHGRKGIKYLQESKTWKDNGGGRGFGWITRKVVRYRCNMDSMDMKTLPSESLPRSSSL